MNQENKCLIKSCQQENCLPHCPCDCHQPPIETDGGEGMRQVLIPAARQYGRLSQQMKEFYLYCKAGKNVVFRMPEGDIYSPEALKAQISLLQSQVLERVEEDIKPVSEEDTEAGWKEHYEGYNEAKREDVNYIKQVFKL